MVGEAAAGTSAGGDAAATGSIDAAPCVRGARAGSGEAPEASAPTSVLTTLPPGGSTIAMGAAGWAGAMTEEVPPAGVGDARAGEGGGGVTVERAGSRPRGST
jgi:hypothetical protein